MTLLGSQDTGLGNVDTAGQPAGNGGGGSVEEITSTDGSVAISDPTGPTVNLSVPAAQTPASAIPGLTFPIVAGKPTLSATAPVVLPGLQVNGATDLNAGVNVAGAPAVFNDGIQASGANVLNGTTEIEELTVDSAGMTVNGPANLNAGVNVAGAPAVFNNGIQASGTNTLDGATEIEALAIDAADSITVDPAATVSGLTRSVATTDPFLGVMTAAAIASITQSIAATWGTPGASPGSIRYFAVDGGAGVDAPGRGFSDASQPAAGTNACKTIAFLLTILPRFGNGRSARVAILQGNYAHPILDLSGFQGYQELLIIGTVTNSTAAATAFAGDAPDTIMAGMQTATGMNGGGYNATAVAISGGQTVLTVQIAGGGAPGFSAAPARPYGCRVRFDANTTTVALRNAASGVLLTPSSNSLSLSSPLPAAPVAADIFYIEMPGVTGPTSTLINHTGGESNLGNPVMQLCGLSLGTIETSCSHFRLTACEAVNLIGYKSFIVSQQSVNNVPFAQTTPGFGLRYSFANLVACGFLFTDIASISTANMNQAQSPTAILWERSAAGSGWAIHGAADATGDNDTDTFGTNSSTVHGSRCEIWGPPSSPPTGVPKCGLSLEAGLTLGQIHFSNMGSSPCVVASGTGFGSTLLQLTGSAADGNTDVGFELLPQFAVGNNPGANGQTLAMPLGGNLPSVTGTNGDVRLAGGQIVSWASLAANGIADTAGNRFISATPPTGTILFSGILQANGATAVTSYLANAGPGEGSNQVSPNLYPSGFKIFTGLRAVVNPGDSLTTSCTVTLIKTSPSTGGQVATTMQVTIPAGSATGFQAADIAHPQLFLAGATPAAGDAYDVRADAAAGTVGTSIGVAVSLEYAV